MKNPNRFLIFLIGMLMFGPQISYSFNCKPGRITQVHHIRVSTQAAVPEGPEIRLKVRTDRYGLNQPPLALHIEMAKSTFIIGEPINITAKLCNQSSEPIALYQRNDFLQVSVSKDGVDFQLIKEGIFPRVQVREPRKDLLRPGDLWEFKAVVLYSYQSSSKLVIEQPGEYYLRAEYWGYELEDSQSGWPNFLKSNVATIFVEEAKDIDTKVFEMLRGDDGTFKDYAYLVRGALEGNGDPIEKFYEIVHSYPRSAYTPIVRRALIGYFEQRMKSTNKPRLSEKERQMYESLRMQN